MTAIVALKKIIRKLGVFAVALPLLISALTTPFATALTPTPQQIQAIKNLPESEQRRLAAQLGIDFDQVSSDSKASSVYTPTSSVQPRSVNDVPEDLLPSSVGDGNGLEDEGLVEDLQESSLDDLDNGKEIEKTEALKLYGYDLFAGSPTTFAPATDIPVSSDYLVGPGDSVVVQFYGKQSAIHDLAVDREGIIAFPDIGPLNVSGMNFTELKKYITKVVSEQMIGVKATVTMGALRSIRVFVLGEAYRPGSYTISSLSTMTNALFSSGGITEVGSLRRIQLKRRGEIVGEFDLYDLLLKGDTRHDMRLLPGDVIFIPTIGQTVGVAGEVKRPAIYELKNEKSAAEVIKLAGGFLPTAFPAASKIERIDTQGNRTVLDVDLTQEQGNAHLIRDADRVQVFSVLDSLEDVVLLDGHVKRPGGFAWRKGMRVTDVIPGVYSLLPNPDLNYALIKRELQPTRGIELLKIDLNAAFRAPESPANKLLNPNDELLVFGLGEQRRTYIDELNEQLKFQTIHSQFPNTASIQGNVYEPGEYPIHREMTYGELLDAALSVKPGTDIAHAALVHVEAATGLLSVELISLGGTSLDRTVQRGDQLFVFDFVEDRAETLALISAQLSSQSSQKKAPQVVSISGFVRSPGDYPLTFGLTVGELVGLSGGFKEEAYSLSAEITRYEVNQAQHQVTRRIALDLTADQNGLNTILQSRDQLYIKQTPNWNQQKTVSIQGEVNFPGTYPIYKGDTITALLRRAGGLTEYAEPGAAVFLRENLREREQQQLDRFRKQLERDVSSLKLEATQDLSGAKKIASSGDLLLDQLNTTEAVGRLVIDLPAILNATVAKKQKAHSETFRSGEYDFDIELKDMDRLIIPPKNPEVTVLGEVQFPTSHTYVKGSDVFDYIESSGGYNSRSDDGRIYVIKASGRVAAVKNGWIFNRNADVGPGDTIIVPYYIYSVGPMTYWTNVSQILFQLATTVAALNTVGVF
ncbi:MAG: SLBB domain-containing protein [Pseudomonadales bacterium]|nr:SLBB domain-containing protein [Pseudomonadales bacterium]